MLLREEAI